MTHPNAPDSPFPNKMVRSTVLLLIGLCWLPGVSVAVEEETEFKPATPIYVAPSEDAPIELTVGGADGSNSESIALRLIPRDAAIEQVFIVPGDHGYISVGFDVTRKANRWQGWIALSKQSRGGPAAGMGTPTVGLRLEVSISTDSAARQVDVTQDGNPIALSARSVSWDELAAAVDPVDPNKSWPAWYGPHGNFSAQESGHQLVADLSDARLVWKSQQRFGSGKAQSPRYGVMTASKNLLPLLPSGGGASPVVGGGRVCVYYLQPSGDAVDQQLLAQRKERAGSEELPSFEYDLWRIAADDVIACLDGRTGRTLWKTVYPGAGANWHDSKAGPCNVTPCLYDGKLYSIGSTGRLYCLDAETGRQIWQHHIGRRHLAVAASKRTALAEKQYGRLKFNRDFGGAPTVIGGVLVMPDFTSTRACGLLAFDPRNGRPLWQLPATAAEDAVPLPFVCNRQQYILSGVSDAGAGSGRIRCIEPVTGKIRWEITEGIGGNATTMCVWKNWLLAHAPSTGKPPTDKGEPVTVGCFRVSADGFEKAWTLPLTHGIWKDHPLAAADGFVYVRLTGPELLCIDIASGKIVARTNYDTGAGATMTLAEGHLIVDRDGSHAGTEFSFFVVDPPAGRLEALTRDFSLPHWHGTSYHPPHSFPYVDGRLFVRGGDGIYCYDIRKGS